MTISPTARLTSKQKADLNKMNAASARAGGLGARLDAMEYGAVATPSAGSVSAMTAVKYSTTPAIGTATYVHAAIAMTSGAQTITTGITQPDFPRIVTIKGNAGGNSGNVVINGTDIAGAVLTETIALNGSTEVLGTKAFKTVTSIVLPAETHAGTDTTSIGVGNKIGFPIAVPNASTVIAKTFDGAVDSTTVTASATLALSLAAVAGTFNGAKVYELVFLA
jgi:hypothetical protein